jgi:hypothetical protein
MRVQFKMEGGLAYLPGLSRPSTMDTAQMPAEEAGELERLVNAAGFFNLPPVVGAPARGAADYRQYTITVETPEGAHTVRVVEPVADPALQALVAYLRGRSRRPPGG